jgi:inosine/xanthosine triphosphatase
MIKPAILGGTFDPLHDGHKALFEKAFEVSKVVLIGLTSDKMARCDRKRKIAEFKIRKRRLAQNLYRTFPGRKFRIEEMNEVFNIPILKDIKDGYLIVSEEKYKVGKAINRKRKKLGEKPFEIVYVPYVLAADGLPIKASRVASGDIDRYGRLIKPIIAAVGSKNKVKVRSVEMAFKKVFGNCKVKGLTVDSGVSPQPIDNETITGAENRAHAAFDKFPLKSNPTFAVGLEAGLFWVPTIKQFVDVQYCAILDKGGNITYGHSPGFYYPPQFYDEIEKGEEIGTIVEDLYGISDIGKKNGAIGFLTSDRVTREDLLVSAVEMALVPRMKYTLYRKK